MKYPKGISCKGIRLNKTQRCRAALRKPFQRDYTGLDFSVGFNFSIITLFLDCFMCLTTLQETYQLGHMWGKITFKKLRCKIFLFIIPFVYISNDSPLPSYPSTNTPSHTCPSPPFCLYEGDPSPTNTLLPHYSSIPLH